MTNLAGKNKPRAMPTAQFMSFHAFFIYSILSLQNVCNLYTVFKFAGSLAHGVSDPENVASSSLVMLIDASSFSY